MLTKRIALKLFAITAIVLTSLVAWLTWSVRGQLQTVFIDQYGEILQPLAATQLADTRETLLLLGSEASFTVETQDNSDQAIWRRSGDVLEVGKQLTMNLSGVTLEEVSLYDVIVSNERGEVLSDHFFLSLFDFAEKTGSFIHPVNEAFNISSSTDLGTWSLIDEGVSRVAGPTSGVETSSFVLDLDSSAAFVRLNLEQ
ncbi:hypothetical protein OAG85_03330 [Verrucomicrobiales bacterium]|nr:hypothetical protein [Verrucomicrobiales bacterium]